MPDVPLNLETLKIIFPYRLTLAGIGLIESLPTLNLIGDMTQTRGEPNRACVGQGVANVVTGFFGGMGGCAIIGQSMINVTNGAVKDLSDIAAPLFLLGFILFASHWMEMIPLAALIGLMFAMSEKTFEWGGLRLFDKVSHADLLVVITVAVVTVMTDLAIAVIVGVIISALVFAWQHTRNIEVNVLEDPLHHPADNRLG